MRSRAAPDGDISTFLADCATRVDRALDRLIPPAEGPLATLYDAIRYAVFPGGKRIRPAVTMAMCQARGGRVEQALPAACAVELIHCYSLVHDDLPCMDDAAMRRGRPSCHVKYGEAMAVLVGDALQAMAFQALGERADLAAELARWAGPEGLVGGQALDLEKGAPTIERVRQIHLRKTAALFVCSSRLGALCAPKTPPREVARAETYGRALGMLFQTVDDLLDLEEEPGKLTLPGAVGAARAHAEARRLAAQARRAARSDARLAQIVGFVIEQIQSVPSRKTK